MASCNVKRDNKQEGQIISEATFSNVEINLDPEYFDSLSHLLPSPELIVLEENDSVMYADLDKLIAKGNKFYIMDSFGSRTVVSFDSEGKPVARYGKVGQGPGEYVRPWDVDIRNGMVYILDSNLKKILEFTDAGEYVGERAIPFVADGFHMLANGNIVLSRLPDGSGSNRLCVVDSAMNVIEEMLPVKSGYVGGFVTPDIFQCSTDYLSYYKAPLDTLFLLAKDGMPCQGFSFDFGSKGVPELAKKDFLESRRNKGMEGKRMFANNPIPLANGLMAGIVMEDDRQFTVLFNPSENRCGGWNSAEAHSVLDMVEPCAADENRNLICYTSIEYAQEMDDYNQLDGKIKSGLENNNRLLIIYPFSKLQQSAM